MARSSPTTGVLDDRDCPLPAVPPEMLHRLVWHDREPPPRLRRQRALQTLITIAAAAYLVYQISRTPRGLSLAVWSSPAFLIGPIVVVIIAVFAKRRSVQWSAPRPPTGPFRRRLPPLTALLAAHRDCGACGYDLRSVMPDADARAACPECGAAWHEDRWTMSAHPLHDSDLLVDTVTGKKAAGPLLADDRGVPFDVTPFSVSAWLKRERMPRDLAAALSAANARTRRTWLRGMSAAVGALWVLASVLFHHFYNGAPRDLLFDSVLFGLVTLIIAIALLYLASRAEISAPDARALMLAHRICPNCFDRYPDPAHAPPASLFDGCTPCVGCGRAWRLIARDTPPDPVQSPPPGA